MKDNWNELFDSMKEEGILRNLPEELPEMEDELVAKRIENRVMQEMEKETAQQKKWNRKRLLVAAVCCIAAVGALGHKPIMAAFQRLFHDLPGVGVYINEEDVKVYEVQIDDPVQEKDGVRVELRDFYCEGKQIYGTVRITGENLAKFDDEMSHKERDAILDEKFPTTWHYGEKSKKFHASGRRFLTEDDGTLKMYEQDGDEWNYLEKGIDTYYLEVGGFDRIFTLKLVEPKTVETPEGIGYSVTKNDTTVTARAAIVDDMIEVEYFIIPSPEVKLAQAKRYKTYIANWPYKYDMEDRTHVKNADGEEMQYEKFRNIANGQKFWYKGTAEDFPLTFHRPTLTGTNNENYTVDIPVPENGGKFTENLPKLEFSYGTVEILSVTSEEIQHDIGNTGEPEYVPALQVDLIYQVTPKDGVRQLYDVDIDYNMIEDWYGSEGLDAGDDYTVKGTRIYLKNLESDKITLKFHLPSFWIVGDYDIIIEKPVYKENNASAIDVERDKEDDYFNIG